MPASLLDSCCRHLSRLHTTADASISRTLTVSEHNYAQLEKKPLLQFLERNCFTNICGRYFSQVTDHKPLTAILGAQERNLLSYGSHKKMTRYFSAVIGNSFSGFNSPKVLYNFPEIAYGFTENIAAILWTPKSIIQVYGDNPSRRSACAVSSAVKGIF